MTLLLLQTLTLQCIWDATTLLPLKSSVAQLLVFQNLFLIKDEKTVFTILAFFWVVVVVVVVCVGGGGVWGGGGGGGGGLWG